MRVFHLLGLFAPGELDVVREGVPLVLPGSMSPDHQDRVIDLVQTCESRKGLVRVDMTWCDGFDQAQLRYLDLARRESATSLVVVHVERGAPAPVLADPAVRGLPHVVVAIPRPGGGEDLAALQRLVREVTARAALRYESLCDALPLRPHGWRELLEALEPSTNPAHLIEGLDAYVHAQLEAQAPRRCIEAALATIVGGELRWRPVDEFVALVALAWRDLEDLEELAPDGVAEVIEGLRRQGLWRDEALQGWSRHVRHRKVLRAALGHAAYEVPTCEESSWWDRLDEVLAWAGLERPGQRGHLLLDPPCCAPQDAIDGFIGEPDAESSPFDGEGAATGSDDPRCLNLALAAFDRGVVFARDERWADAERNFRQALVLLPEDGSQRWRIVERGVVLHELGNALAARGRWTEAEETFREALRSKQANAAAAGSVGVTALHLALAQRALGQDEAAEKSLDEAIATLRCGDSVLTHAIALGERAVTRHRRRQDAALAEVAARLWETSTSKPVPPGALADALTGLKGSVRFFALAGTRNVVNLGRELDALIRRLGEWSREESEGAHAP